MGEKGYKAKRPETRRFPVLLVTPTGFEPVLPPNDDSPDGWQSSAESTKRARSRIPSLPSWTSSTAGMCRSANRPPTAPTIESDFHRKSTHPAPEQSGAGLLLCPLRESRGRVQESAMNKMPWGTNQLRKLGKCIQLDLVPPDSLPAYGEVMLHYNDVAAETQEAIRSLDWESLLSDRSFEVTSRPKTIDTLRQKLQRDTSTPLSNIQDIAGVRFEAEMTLDEQDAVVNAIVGLFDHDPMTCVRDMRLEPHSGYRAVHIWLRFPTRVEVQVRTHLQSAWANMYESLADVYGRGIRYGEIPEDEDAKGWVEALQGMSVNHITKLEKAKNDLSQGGDELGQLRAAFQLLPRGQKRRKRKHFEKQVAWHADMTRGVAQMENETSAMMHKLKETFDTMRSNGRK